MLEKRWRLKLALDRTGEAYGVFSFRPIATTGRKIEGKPTGRSKNDKKEQGKGEPRRIKGDGRKENERMKGWEGEEKGRLVSSRYPFKVLLYLPGRLPEERGETAFVAPELWWPWKLAGLNESCEHSGRL